MVLTSRTVDNKKRRKLWLSTFWKRKISASDGFDKENCFAQVHGTVLPAVSPASSQLWAYFDLITGNLPFRPWSRLVRGWKYKQLVVKAAMAASLVPPPENISLHKVGLQQGHRLKLYSFDFQHQRLFPLRSKTMTMNQRSKNTIFRGLETLIAGWHKLGTRCRFFWTAPGLAIYGNLWQFAFQRRFKVRQVANNKRYVSYRVRGRFQLRNQKFWQFCISTKVQSKISC